MMDSVEETTILLTITALGDIYRMSEYFRRVIIKFFLRKEFISAKIATSLINWRHSGFSVDASGGVPAGSFKTREALPCNVPVLCTEIGDACLVNDGIDGYAIVDADPPSIANALNKALLLPRRVASRDRRGAYSLESMARRIIEIYEEVASG